MCQAKRTGQTMPLNLTLRSLPTASPAARPTITLLTDLTPALEVDSASGKLKLHFSVNVPLKPGNTSVRLLLDGSLWSTHYARTCSVDPPEPGYHLLRAFIWDEGSNQCWKCENAYIEAEFHFQAFVPQPAVRPFLFGQPSLCALPVPAAGGSTLVDFFVHNCTVSEAPFGFQIRVYVNGKKVGGDVSEWKSLELEGLKAGKEATVRLALVAPSGEEAALPEFNCGDLSMEVPG